MQRFEVQLEDDLTGGPADETVQFGVDGRTYELDLSAKHAADFRHRLAPFVRHARLARRGSHPTVRTSANRERSRQIRAWAERQGYDVAAHGRLPANVVRQYDDAQRGGQPAAVRTRRSQARHRTT